MPPCLTLSIITYGSKVKWGNLGKGAAISPTPRCSSYCKWSLPVALDYDKQTLYIYIYIYIYIFRINSVLFGIYSKNYFSLVFGQFKMVSNQTECSRFEQRYVIKFSVSEKYKPCEIYRRISDVYREACFSLKMFINGLNISLPGSKKQTMVNRMTS